MTKLNKTIRISLLNSFIFYILLPISILKSSLSFAEMTGIFLLKELSTEGAEY